MRAMAILCLSLLGCGQSRADPYEAVLASALFCVERQVPEGTLVSATRAHSVVSACKQEFEQWSRVVVERGFSKRFDDRDPNMMNAYDRVLQDKVELMQLRISDGPHQTLPTI